MMTQDMPVSDHINRLTDANEMKLYYTKMKWYSIATVRELENRRPVCKEMTQIFEQVERRIYDGNFRKN